MSQPVMRPVGRRHDLVVDETVLIMPPDGAAVREPITATVVEVDGSRVRYTTPGRPADGPGGPVDVDFRYPDRGYDHARPVDAFAVGEVVEHWLDHYPTVGELDPHWRAARIEEITAPIDRPDVKFGPMLRLLYLDRTGIGPVPEPDDGPWRTSSDVLVFTPVRLATVRRVRTAEQLVTSGDVAAWRGGAMFDARDLTDDEVRDGIVALDRHRDERG